MFTLQRIEKIKEILREKKQIDVQSLSRILKVSDVTVRKYLDKLKEEGFITKTHGGAVLIDDKKNSKGHKLISQIVILPLSN
ncbi:MAG: DeoR family transcriptional regulator [Spirochaetes bacterium]|nr:DeoR family transcriptional regulator [Spirochaetota bacterium]